MAEFSLVGWWAGRGGGSRNVLGWEVETPRLFRGAFSDVGRLACRRRGLTSDLIRGVCKFLPGPARVGAGRGGGGGAGGAVLRGGGGGPRGGGAGGVVEVRAGVGGGGGVPPPPRRELGPRDAPPIRVQALPADGPRR